MKEFNHRHVMQLIGVSTESGVGVVMPYMANGSVLSYLKKEKMTLLLNEDTDIEKVVIIMYTISIRIVLMIISAQL